MQITPSAPAAARPTVAGNTGPIPVIPSAYVANTYGADIRALGATRVLPSRTSAMQVDVLYDSRATGMLAGLVLNDTIEGVKLNHAWTGGDRFPVDFAVANVVHLLKGANLVGSDGVSSFGLNGTGSIVVWAKDDAARNHLDSLLADNVLGWKLTVAVNNPISITDPVVIGGPGNPCIIPGPNGEHPPVVGGPDTCFIPGPNGEHPPVK